MVADQVFDEMHEWVCFVTRVCVKLLVNGCLKTLSLEGVKFEILDSASGSWSLGLDGGGETVQGLLNNGLILFFQFMVCNGVLNHSQ